MCCLSCIEIYCALYLVTIYLFEAIYVCVLYSFYKLSGTWFSVEARHVPLD